ncbi:hypothetical protein [Dyadobacter psychrotolerans]|uniref:Outer membrane protein beta-barrel domain-containing protein n=1 Tax=Dyadobacter psychrotolerans TaxID=2541721 RepID=A0A4R5DSI6_9BACT|nr:hypothetical protein [Dyadobacter psychrotolerans]TDE13823.1 hypothetical protein E0F88_18200 [Dyadobacter psychrotolerans]
MKSLFLFTIHLLILSPVMAQKSVPVKRFVNHTEVGGLFGRVNYGDVANNNPEMSESKVSLTVQSYGGIKLNDRLSTGLTVAIDWYKAALINPVSAGVRYDLTNGKAARLFASADAGYGFAWFHNDLDGYKTKGGLMLNPGIGLKYGKPGNSAFTIVLSWKRQQVQVDKPPLWNGTERWEDRVYNRLAVRIGMSI